MFKTNFSSNHANKLLADHFTTIRLHDGKYIIGQDRKMYLRGQYIGIAQVMNIIQFQLRYIPDTVAFADAGGNAQYVKRILYKFYADIHEQSVFDIVNLKWIERAPDTTLEMFNNAWDAIAKKFPQPKEMELKYA